MDEEMNRFPRLAFPEFLAALSLGACVFETGPEPPVKSLAYTAKVSRSGGERCSVFVNILRWPAEESIRFQLPPYYADNPRMPVPGVDPARILAEDHGGQAVAAQTAIPPFTQGGGTWISFPPGTEKLRYSVDLDPSDSGRFGPPMPGLGPDLQMIDGSTLFILPAAGNSLAEQWRNPLSLQFDWVLENGITSAGALAMKPRFNYQLMFLRGAINPLRTLEFPLGSHRVTLYTTSPYDTLSLPALADKLRLWIPLLEARLLPLPWERLAIGTNPVFYGLEGVAGYWFKQNAASDAEAHLHELTHAFVGVMQGELEDPWWKEGVTNYFGKLLSVQAGYNTDSAVWGYLIQTRDTVPSILQYALADPGVRDRFFYPLDSAYRDNPPLDFYSLLYGKGAQAAMIIDAWLAEHGDHDLFEAERMLFQTGRTAFTRAQFAAVLTGLAGLPADTLLQTLCDRPGAFSTAQLQAAFDTVKDHGHFLPPPGFITVPKSAAVPGTSRHTPLTWEGMEKF